MSRKRAKPNYGPCRMDCGRKATHKEARTCDACYQWFWYWMRQKPAKFFRRAKQIATLQRRAEMLATPREVKVKKRA